MRGSPAPHGHPAHPMSVLNVTGLKKLLGAQEILRGADLRIENGEKVGCVGRNGEGKTTFLRLLTGELTPDGGKVQLTRGARMGYVEQRPAFAEGVTVRSYVESGLEEVHRVEKELEKVHEGLGEAEGEALESLLKRQDDLTARMEFLDGWNAERRIETVLSGIGLKEHLWDREARTLSGGEKSRTAMARELVSVPDLLLLDEPTNHLDLVGIEWLESYLREIHSAVFLVSHDRRLLDRLVDAIAEVERGLVNRYTGNYSKYLVLKKERYEFALREWEHQQAFIRKEENFVKKHMGSQRTGEAKGRRKRLQSLERLERPYHDVRRPTIRVQSVERGGEIVLATHDLAIGHGDNVLLEGIELRVGRGERIGLVGPNGAGKTTLLKALAERTKPLKGTIERGYKSSCGFYDQETADLRDDGTPFTEIRRVRPKMTDEEVRSHLARFLFRGDEIDLEVRGLSGGERARLSLSKLVLSDPSWLALDEPTNHLDLAGRTALEEMLAEFPGALIVITHDREFLDGLTNRILEVRDGKLRSFRGNYSDYRGALEAEETERVEKAAAQAKKKRDAERAAAAKKETAKTKKGKSKQKKGNPWRIKKLEEEIIQLEEEKERLLEALGSEEVYRDSDKLRESQFRLAEIERDLTEKNTEWEASI